jgi:hypothetical protein
MKILITTLSIGENYTRDYTLRMIEDVILLTDIDIYITTDCKDIIIDKFGDTDRVKIKEINRDDIKVSLPIGPNKGARDFNFNMRYLCLDHVKDIDDAIIILDEAANCSWQELSAVITRVGHRSKLIVCGDRFQNDLQKTKYD